MKIRTLFIIALLPGLIGCAKWYKPLLVPLAVPAAPFVVALWGIGMKKYSPPNYHFYSLPIEDQANATYKHPWTNQPKAGFNQWIKFPLDEKKALYNQREKSPPSALIKNVNDKVLVLRSGDEVTIELEEPLLVSGINIVSCLSKSNFNSKGCCIRFCFEDGTYQDESFIPYGWDVGRTLNGKPIQAPLQAGNVIYLDAQTHEGKETIGRLRIDSICFDQTMEVSKVELIFDNHADGAELLIAGAALYHVEIKNDKKEKPVETEPTP